MYCVNYSRCTSDYNGWRVDIPMYTWKDGVSHYVRLVYILGLFGFSC